MPKVVKNKLSEAYDLNKGLVVGRDNTLQNNGNLRLWLRFNSTLTNLSEYDSSTVSAISYEGSPVINENDQIGRKTYSSALFDNTDNANGIVEFTGVNNLTTFTDGSQDLPFSISFFYKRSSATASGDTEYFFYKGDPDNLNTNEFYCLYNHSTGIMFLLLEDEAENQSKYKTVGVNLQNDVWHHIVVTVQFGNDADQDIQFYVDGNLLTNTLNAVQESNYNSINAVSDTLVIGANRTGDFEADGYFSEFSIWDKTLSLSEVRAIYYATIEGWKTKSGFVSLPPRYIVGQRDSATGSYPTILRTGDRDRRGRYSVSFNDMYTQVFGKKFVDEFDNYGLGSETSFDSSRWLASSGMRIRKEVTQSKRGSISSDRLLVFGFTSNTLGRWIQTTEAYRNPVIRFSLIQGPLESTIGNLKLVEGQSTDTLKIQASNDGNTWIDIKTFTPQKNQQSFYRNRNTDLKESDYKEAFRSNQVLYRGDFSEISGDFYIRWIQEENLRTRKPAAVWAISRIEIEDLSSQNVNAPLMIDNSSTAGVKAHANAVASPNIVPQLQTRGRVLKGVSDSHITFTPGEDISPFNESLAIEDYNKLFYSSGIDAEVYSGFNQPTRDKTKILISLNSEDTETDPKSFGMESPVTTADPSDETGTGAQMLMVYFNNQSKIWTNYVGFDQLDFNATSKTDIENYLSSAQGLGFGPINCVATASEATGEIEEQFGSDILSNFARPVKTTGFPFASDFEVLDDRTVPMSEYIDHPFLLEKIVVKFPAMFEFASGTSDTENQAQKAFRLSYNQYATLPGTDDPSRRKFDNHQVLIPTFFVLNQRRDQFRSVQNVTISDPGFLNPARVANYNVEFNVNPTTDDTPSSRELISYGQMTLFASASDGTLINIYDALEDGLERDLSVDILEKNGQSDWNGSDALEPFTGSFVMEFPCRVSPRTNNSQRVQIRQKNVTFPSAWMKNRSMFLRDDFGGRSYSIIDVLNRSLVNGNTSLTPGESYLAPGPSDTAQPVVAETVDKDSIDQVSPYVLFPEDRLIFGWQYPVPELVRSLPGSGDTKFNKMKLYGETQVFFYGSLIQDNKETHNTLNQNLTSNAVHEIVGAEKVLDQFQTNIRHEYSGSFIDQVNYYRSVGASDEIQPIDSFVAGTPYQRDPVSRVSIFDDAGRRYEVGSSTNIYSFGGSTPDNDVSVALVSSLFRGFNLKSERRIADANYKNDSYWFDYGTYQNYKNPDTDDGPNVFKHSKVYFNYQHFGHVRDMFEQERDTRFGLGYPSSKSIESPVVVEFVSGSFNANKLDFKSFSIRTPSQIANNSNTQSSNMSLNATSSLPYFDDMTARNR